MKGGPQIIASVCVYVYVCVCVSVCCLSLAFDVNAAKRSFAPLLEGYHTSRWPFSDQLGSVRAIALHFSIASGSALSIAFYLPLAGRAVASAQIKGCATYR